MFFATYHAYMASIRINHDAIQVCLSRLEHLGGFHGDITVPLSAVEGVRVVDHPFRALHGYRALGTGFPGLISLGTRRHRNGRDFVAFYKGQKAIQLDLTDMEFDRLLIGLFDPDALLSQLERRVGSRER